MFVSFFTQCVCFILLKTYRLPTTGNPHPSDHSLLQYLFPPRPLFLPPHLLQAQWSTQIQGKGRKKLYFQRPLQRRPQKQMSEWWKHFSICCEEIVALTLQDNCPRFYPCETVRYWLNRCYFSTTKYLKCNFVKTNTHLDCHTGSCECVSSGLSGGVFHSKSLRGTENRLCSRGNHTPNRV